MADPAILTHQPLTLFRDAQLAMFSSLSRQVLRIVLLMLVLSVASSAFAQPSVARLWDEQLLHAISLDTARPTVHARNLFHLSTAMYDAWAAYDTTAVQYRHHEKALRWRH